MSFIIQPGTIPHIQHLYQPTETDWDISSGLGLELLNLLNSSLLTGTKAYKLSASYKIDDRVSMKVAKIDGVHYVGYKGLNSPFLDTKEQIEFLYKDKKYISRPLLALLKYANIIIPEDENNIEIQVGVMWYQPSSLFYENYDDPYPAPYSITPNVVTYNIKNMSSKTQLIISIVSITKIGEDSKLHLTQDYSEIANKIKKLKSESPATNKFFGRKYHLSRFNRTDEGLYILENKINFSSKSKRDFTAEITNTNIIRTWMLDNKVFDKLRGFEVYISTYFNWCNRNNVTSDFDGFINWFKDIYIVKKVTKLKKEANQIKKFEELSTELAYIITESQAFDVSIEFCKELRSLSFDMLKEVMQLENSNFNQSEINEGIVLSYPYDDQSLIMFKIVPTEFSIANFAKVRNE